MLRFALFVVLLWSGQVHATDTCDGYFHKADCLASETGCGWKGCMYTAMQCPAGTSNCGAGSKVLVEEDVPAFVRICVPLKYSSSYDTWGCDDDPVGYPCPAQYTPPGDAPTPTSRKCIVGVTKVAKSQESGEGWLVGFSGGIGGFIVLLIGAVVLVGIGTVCCWYGCKGQCEPLNQADGGNGVFSDDDYEDDDDDHLDHGGGLEAAVWTDSEDEDEADGDGIQLEDL